MTTFTHDDYIASVKDMLSTLRVLQISKVEVEFSGSGDSGSINDIWCDNQAVKLKEYKVRAITKLSYYDQKANDWVETYVEKQTSLHDALETFTYEELSKTGIDWYNNDGGQGKLEIDFTDGEPRVDLNVSVNIVETQDNYFDLAYDFGLTEQAKED